jgi:hypothetical protein
VEPVFAEFVVFGSFLVDGVCSDVLWDLCFWYLSTWFFLFLLSILVMLTVAWNDESKKATLVASGS